MRRALLLIALLALAACGGGSSDGSDPGPVNPVADLLPGDEIPPDTGITLTTSGTYGIPEGSFELVMLCDGFVSFEATPLGGEPVTGSCQTGIAAQAVTGPGGLTLDFAAGASALLTLTPSA